MKKRKVDSVIRHPLYFSQVSSIYCLSCLSLLTLWKSLAKIVRSFSVFKMWSKTIIYSASVRYGIDIRIFSRIPWRHVYPNLRTQRNLPYHVARFTDIYIYTCVPYYLIFVWLSVLHAQFRITILALIESNVLRTRFELYTEACEIEEAWVVEFTNCEQVWQNYFGHLKW